MLKRILASTTGSNKNGASKIYYNGKQVYKAYIGSSLVYDVVNGRDFDFTYNSANQKFTFTNWKQTVDGVANTTHFLVKDDPTIIVDLGAITGHNTTIKNISIPYNVSIAKNSLVRAFADCSNLTNASISNPNITNMAYSFSSCSNLKSSPFCGDKVANMSFAYYNCYNLTGQPVVGKNVTNMAAAYANCYNVTGNPVCSNASVSMFEAFRACKNLTGAPVCSPKATSMLWCYYQCWNITGAPACGDKVTNFVQAYSYCNHLNGQPVCGNSVTNMFGTYSSCYNLTGSPVSGPNVVDMYNTYYACYNLTGSPACGPNVTNMSNTFYYCNNITGQPVCGDKVTNMHYAYYFCQNLTGYPVCGPNVVDFSAAYSRCYNISGPPVYKEKVTNMTSSYYQCWSLTGPAIIGENVTAAQHAYCNCGNLSSNAYILSSKIPSVYNCFAEHAKEVVNTIYVPANSTTLNACLATTQASSLTNTAITWTNEISTNGRYYNPTYNISICPVADVKQVYKENELLVARYTMNSGANVVPETTIEGKREVKVTSENWNPQFSLGTLGVDITSMEEITTSVGDFYYMDDYTDIFGYVEYRYGTSGKDRVYLSVDSDTKNVFIENMLTSDSEALEEVILYIPGKVDVTTMTTAEDTTNNNGTITRSVYLDASQAGKHPSSISFNGETNLLTVEKLRADSMTDTSHMFNGCSNLTSVSILDLDTSKILYADYMFAGCSKLTKESFVSENGDYVYDLKYKSNIYTLNSDEKIKLFDYTSSEFNFITLNNPITEHHIEGQLAFNPKIERSDMYECTYYTFGNTEPIVITVYDDGGVYAYSNGPSGDVSLYLYNRYKYSFELPNVVSASHIFDGCTKLL